MNQNDLISKSTDDLRTELKSNKKLQRFLEENEKEFIHPNISEDLHNLIQEKGISKSELAKRSGMSTVYLYQLLNGTRFPSRDRLICLCIGLSCFLEETQEILKSNRFAALYMKVRRDAIISFGIQNRCDINEINDLLYENNEETLS